MQVITKGHHAKSVIEEWTTGMKARDDRVQVWHFDMNSYDSIRDFAHRASTTLDRLDVAMLNAGIYMVNYQESSYGWEQT